MKSTELTHKVMEAFTRLKNFAKDTGSLVVIVDHFRKAGADKAKDRIAGSERGNKRMDWRILPISAEMTTDAKIILLLILQLLTLALVAAKFYPRQANTNQVNIEQSSKFQ